MKYYLIIWNKLSILFNFYSENSNVLLFIFSTLILVRNSKKNKAISSDKNKIWSLTIERGDRIFLLAFYIVSPIN